MTIRMLLAAALLIPAAAGAQGWGSEGNDPNHPASAAPAASAAAEPAPAKAAPVKIRPKAASAHYDDDGGYELNDAALDRSRAIVDRQLASRKTALAAQTQRLDGYHAAMEKDSVDAERQMAEERKAFLLYLKSVPQEDRPDAMKHFEERQADKRKELDKRHLAQYKAWFEENIRDQWRTQPLAAEDVAMPMAAAEPAAAAEVAQAAPVKHQAAPMHPKAKRHVVHHARTRRVQAQAAEAPAPVPARAAMPAARAPMAQPAPAQSPAPAPIAPAAQPQ